jgi:hypothetical protein
MLLVLFENEQLAGVLGSGFWLDGEAAESRF